MDLAHGEAREAAFVDAIRFARVEHKSDDKGNRTGNAFIEVRQKGRDSGISTTTAEWWAVGLEDRWVVIRTSTLKEITKAVYRERIAAGLPGTVAGGDFNKFDGVLVPLSRLLDTDFPPSRGTK